MHYRTLFVSDIHLGTKQCQIEYLLKFIHDNTFDNVYLVGDIVDIYALSHSWYWTKDFNTFIQKVLRMSRKGTKVTYIPGNHDEVMREYIKDNDAFYFGDILIKEQDDYRTVKGKKYLVIHGDCFDGAIRSIGWLYFLGDRAYDFALAINTVYNKIRKLFGMQYWSLSAYLKSKVKKALEVMNKFDEMVVRKCITEGYDGIIYGHTHTPGFKNIKTKDCLNTGDSVENCTCILETVEGDIELISLIDYKVLQRM